MRLLHSPQPSLPPSQHPPIRPPPHAHTPTPHPLNPQAFTAFAKSYGLKDPKELLTPKYIDLLTKIGAYHIVDSAAYSSAQLKDGQQLTTIEGGKLTVQK